MKRRTFIQSTLISAPIAAGTAAATNRVFGTPGSVSEGRNFVAGSGDRLYLSLSRTGLPEEFWTRARSLTKMISGVLQSPTEAKKFWTSPAKYLSNFGVDGSDAVLRDETVRLLSAISDPKVKSAIADKDYKATLSYLKSAGAISFDSSHLEKELIAALKKNADEVRAVLSRSATSIPRSDRETYLALLGESGTGLTEDELALTYELISSDIEESELAIVVVTIAIALVTVAVGAVLWVYTAGWVVGGPLEKAVSGTSFGKLAEADPALITNFERVTKIAALTGEKEIVEQGARELIIAECSAIVQALRTADLIHVKDDAAERIIETMAIYAYRMVGV